MKIKFLSGVLLFCLSCLIGCSGSSKGIRRGNGWYLVLSGQKDSIPQEPVVAVKDFTALRLETDSMGHTVITGTVSLSKRDKWAEATERNIGNRLCFIFNGAIITAPRVNMRMESGNFQISNPYGHDLEKLYDSIRQEKIDSIEAFPLFAGLKKDSALSKTETDSLLFAMDYYVAAKWVEMSANPDAHYCWSEDTIATDSTRQDADDSTSGNAEECPVDQSAGLQVIEALSKAYGDEPNVVGGFIGSSRCPSFLEGMYFDGATLVFQVRGDTVQARRTLEQAAGSSAFRLEQMTKGTFSDVQLYKIMEEINQRYEALPESNLLKRNMTMWGVTTHHIHVQFIQNTPEARREFREKLSDSPAVLFGGPEQPEENGMTGITDTLGISLRPEYSVYADTATTASFLLINKSNQELMCGEHYSITYEDEQGTWRTLPINTLANDIGILVFPGDYHRFAAHLYPDIHRNKPGRYRFFYDVTMNETGRRFTMMTEFRLTDNEQEVKKAVQTIIADVDSGARNISVDTGTDAGTMTAAGL